MNLKELSAIVAEGESQKVEFKTTTGQRTEGAKAACALANGLGGFVLFGVKDKGQIVGQQVSAHTLEEVANELHRIEPPVFPAIETVELKDGNTVIALRVTGGAGPYMYDGRPYQRHGPTTRVMPREVYEQRVMEKLHATNRWENQPVPKGVTLANLDEDEIQLTVDNAVDLGRLKPLKRRSVRSILIGLGLIVEGKLLNAAVALYGNTQRLQSLYPQCCIRLARFRGKNRLADFADNRQYWGHAFALLRHAESFLMDHVPIAGRVVSGRMRREDRPLYPPRATREAVANALCHRDYTNAGGAVSVAMYDEHLEIINIGTLHFDITPEKLARPHQSRPWNPIIASVFYRAGIIEQWGTGTLKVIDWCRDNANPVPAWTEDSGSVIVTFQPASGFEKVTGEVTREVTPEVTPEVTRLMLKCQTPKTRKALQEELGLRDDEHFRKAYLLPGMEAGLVERTIPDKPKSSKQQYRLTAKGHEWLRQTGQLLQDIDPPLAL